MPVLAQFTNNIALAYMPPVESKMWNVGCAENDSETVSGEKYTKSAES